MPTRNEILVPVQLGWDVTRWMGGKAIGVTRFGTEMVGRRVRGVGESVLKVVYSSYLRDHLHGNELEHEHQLLEKEAKSDGINETKLALSTLRFQRVTMSHAEELAEGGGKASGDFIALMAHNYTDWGLPADLTDPVLEKLRTKELKPMTADQIADYAQSDLAPLETFVAPDRLQSVGTIDLA